MKQSNQAQDPEQSGPLTVRPSCARCQEILRYAISYKREHNGNSPSYRQIGPAVGVSLATVASHVGHLRRDGLVKFSEERQPIELTFGQWTNGSPVIAADATVLCPNCGSLFKMECREYGMLGKCNVCGLEVIGELLIRGYEDGL